MQKYFYELIKTAIMIIIVNYKERNSDSINLMICVKILKFPKIGNSSYLRVI
jgi:hypothetical protein